MKSTAVSHVPKTNNRLAAVIKFEKTKLWRKYPLSITGTFVIIIAVDFRCKQLDLLWFWFFLIQFYPKEIVPDIPNFLIYRNVCLRNWTCVVWGETTVAGGQLVVAPPWKGVWLKLFWIYSGCQTTLRNLLGDKGKGMGFYPSFDFSNCPHSNIPFHYQCTSWYSTQ